MIQTYFSGGPNNKDPAQCTGGQMTAEPSCTDLRRFWTSHNMPKGKSMYRTIYLKNNFAHTYDCIVLITKNPSNMQSLGILEPKNMISPHRETDNIEPEGVVWFKTNKTESVNVGILKPGEFRALHLRLDVPDHGKYGNDWAIDIRGWKMAQIQCKNCGAEAI